MDKNFKEDNYAADDGVLLEKHIQESLSNNLHKLGFGALKLIGLEYPVSFGRIDILAETNDGSLVVIELKRGIANRNAIGQVQSYMGAILDVFPGKPVTGVIVATEMDEAGLAALKTNKNISFCRYSLSFNFFADTRKASESKASTTLWAENSLNSPINQVSAIGTLENKWKLQGAKIGAFSSLCRHCYTRTKKAKINDVSFCMECERPI
jgi:hypothetical protein